MTAEPTCTIIAGPNGAGKTTFALTYLPEIGCRNFVNADLIAAGLSPLAPERERINASRLFLREIETHIRNREDFSFETTLAGKTHLKRIRQMRTYAWQVTLVYLFLPDVDFSLARVEERVAHGGHSIPEADIRRRFPRSLHNLIHAYAPLCDHTLCFDNTGSEPRLIFRRDNEEMVIEDQRAFDTLIRRSKA